MFFSNQLFFLKYLLFVPSLHLFFVPKLHLRSWPKPPPPARPSRWSTGCGAPVRPWSLGRSVRPCSTWTWATRSRRNGGRTVVLEKNAKKWVWKWLGLSEIAELLGWDLAKWDNMTFWSKYVIIDVYINCLSMSLFVLNNVFFMGVGSLQILRRCPKSPGAGNQRCHQEDQGGGIFGPGILERGALGLFTVEVVNGWKKIGPKRKDEMCLDYFSHALVWSRSFFFHVWCYFSHGTGRRWSPRWWRRAPTSSAWTAATAAEGTSKGSIRWSARQPKSWAERCEGQMFQEDCVESCWIILGLDLHFASSCQVSTYLEKLYYEFRRSAQRCSKLSMVGFIKWYFWWFSHVKPMKL